MGPNPHTDSQASRTSGHTINRRNTLKVLGGTAAAGALFAGSAAAHIEDGKGISWVAFCGCDGGYTIRYTRCTEEGELGAVAYDCDGGTVYYKAGRDIYRHEYTRRDDIDWHVIEIDYAGNEDPNLDVHPSTSRDPCGILAGTGGTKLEEDEIRAQAGTDNCE